MDIPSKVKRDNEIFVDAFLDYDDAVVSTGAAACLSFSGSTGHPSGLYSRVSCDRLA